MLFLALDQSTSATKALLFTAAGKVLDRESRDHAQHYPQSGWVEHDAEEIWTNCIQVLGTLSARHAGQWNDVATLSLTNQRETIVLFERGTGRPLHPAIVWQCRRGDAICRAHINAGHEELVRSRTGLKIDPYFSASKLQWLIEHQPALARRLREGSALIGTIDTYLIYRLTGGAVFATDGTNASRTLLFDIVRQQWDPELCALWQVPVNALAEVRESSAWFGATTLEGRWSRPLPISGVMGDSQAALLGQGCLTPGSTKVTFGTGSSLLLNLGPRPRFSSRGVLTTLAWTLRGETAYAHEGVIVASASTLVWLRDQLGLAASVEELGRWAAEVPDNGGVYLVPAFTGLGLPHWAPGARGAIVGLSSHSDKRHVARAAIESIAYQVRDALEAMRHEAGVPITVLAADGGATVNRRLMQFTADITGVDLRVSDVAECSAWGAVLAGRVGRNETGRGHEVLRHNGDGVVYRRNRTEQEVSALLAGWHTAVRQVLLAGSESASSKPSVAS